MKNLIFEEQFLSLFINKDALKIQIVGVLSISVIIFLFYPIENLSYYFTNNLKPEMFNVALYSSTAFISFLSIKSSIFSFKDAKMMSLKDIFSYSKISVLSYLVSRVFFGLFYSFFLFLLFLPILIVSASISHISSRNLLCIFLVIYFLNLSIFSFGLMFFNLFKKANWVLFLLLWFSLLLLLFFSPTFFPENHPVILLRKLQSSTDLLKDTLNPLLVALAANLIMWFISFISLSLFKRRLN